jgi:very-short-patch-repair endonuclease
VLLLGDCAEKSPQPTFLGDRQGGERLAGRAVDAEIVRIASGQGDVIGVEALHELGLNSASILTRVEGGMLVRRYHGVYAVGARPLTRIGEWRAATIACGERSMLFGRSTSQLYGVLGGRIGPIELTAPPGSRTHPGLICRRVAVPLEDRRVISGVPTCSLPWALLGLAATGRGGVVGKALEQADRMGILYANDVIALLKSRKGQPGTRILSDLLDAHVLPDEGLESELEIEFLRVCRADGIPEGERQVLLEGERVDVYFPAAHLAIELDSFRDHARKGPFVRDRRKLVKLQLAGYTVLLFTWTDVFDRPDYVTGAVRQALGLPAPQRSLGNIV